MNDGTVEAGAKALVIEPLRTEDFGGGINGITVTDDSDEEFGFWFLLADPERHMLVMGEHLVPLIRCLQEFARRRGIEIEP